VKAEILTIGDEVMRGEIVDTNKSFLADRLLGLDIETHFQTSVRDDPPAMISLQPFSPRPSASNSCSTKPRSKRFDPSFIPAAER
jgi:hypothetical protein